MREVRYGDHALRAASSGGPGEPGGYHGFWDQRRPREFSALELIFWGYGIAASLAVEPGEVPEAPAAWVSEQDGTFTVGWAGYAEYRISVFPAPHAEIIRGAITEQETSLAFVLSVLPLALPLFDLEPLHGAAVASDEGATLILGASGAGKSTLAAELVSRGFPFLADDACAIDEVGALQPGPPLLQSRTGCANGDLVATYNGKTVVAPSSYGTKPVPIARVLVLAPDTGATLAVRRLDQRETFTAILRHFRAPGVLRERRRNRQLQVVSRLARVPVAALSYDAGHHTAGQVADAIAAGAWIGF